MLETVGRYKVQEKIGEGAMADVYRAYDPSINRPLAIKVLKNEFLQDEEYAARFLREAKAAGALSHPNIVTIFDVGEVSGHPFIVMELLDGKPLDRAMAEKQISNIDEIMNIGMQLARALDYAHSQGIIHRDIKPSNIMLSNDGQSVKILDYGIARLNETDALLGQEVLKTQVGAVLGTPRYMSPEQALGQTSDGRSDLYSVGIVLYELLTGKKAFSSGSMATLMLQITQQDPEPIGKIAPDIPGGLVFIVNKLLAKKPEKRFQKGAELYAALKRELASMEAQKAEKTKPRAMPLPIKVTLIATAFVLSLLSVGIWAALNKQNKVMEKMSVTSGSAISSFVAKNIGPTMLQQDWDQVSVFVKVAAEDKNVDDIVVIDNSGVIRGAKNPALEGRVFRASKGPVLSSKADMTVIETHDKNGNRVFQFSQPVVYANGIYGKVHVGLKQNALEAAAALSRNVLLGLGLMTLLSVILVAYTIASVLSRPMRRLKEAFADASKGNLDFRISHKRKDEFGELFDGFNSMVSAVQSRVDTAEGFTGDIGSSPSLKTGLNLTGIAAGGAVIGTEAMKTSPFSRPEAIDVAPDAEELAQPNPEPETEHLVDTPSDVTEEESTDAMPDDIVAETENSVDHFSPDVSPAEITTPDVVQTNDMANDMTETEDALPASPVSFDEIQDVHAATDFPAPEEDAPDATPVADLPVASEEKEVTEHIETVATQSPVEEDMDFDRTVVRSPLAQAAPGLPVNPLSRKPADDRSETPAEADDVLEEDLDRTIVRPPSR